MKIKKIIPFIIIVLVASLLIIAIYLGIIRKMIAKNNVKDTLSAFTSGDYTNEFYYFNAIGQEQKYLDVGRLGNAILQNSNFDVKISNFKWNSPYATVTINATFPNMQKVYLEKFSESQESIPPETIEDEMIETIIQTEYDTVCKTLTVDIIEYNHKWYLVENESLMDVYTGDLYTQYAKLLQETFGSQ